MVIWLIGISGAGKSTLGYMLQDYLKKLDRKVYVLDGDSVREFFNNDLGYAKQDRIANIKRILLAAHVLNENGIITIVCNIHPFEELRLFARMKIEDYNEIYLRRNLTQSREADVKNMYRNHEGKTDIVGIDTAFDEPKNSDLTIDTGVESREDSFDRLLAFLKNKYPDTF